jgi:hypothetical protein
MSDPIRSNTNIHYKAFKGIHNTANNIYYLCDFYLCKGEQTADTYLIKIETVQKNISEQEFVQNPNNKQWECTNPDELPKELIQKISQQIQLLHSEQ